MNGVYVIWSKGNKKYTIHWHSSSPGRIWCFYRRASNKDFYSRAEAEIFAARKGWAIDG